MLQSKDTEWQIGFKKKQETIICSLQEDQLRQRTHRLKVRGWKKTFQANGNDKKSGVLILISDKMDFKDYKER